MFLKRFSTVMLCLIFTVLLLPAGISAEGEVAIAQAANGSSIQVSGVNRLIQAADELILFTRDNSSPMTDGNVWCAAAIADYQDGRYVITGIKDREGAVEIPYNGFVLFGHGTSEQWIIDNLKPGDEIKINGYTLPQVIDGPAVILENGEKRSIDGANVERQLDGLFIYTSDYGRYTGQFGDDAEEAIVVNNIVIEKNTDGSNGTYIPCNGYVICGTGSEKDFVGKLEAGQKITLANIDIPVVPDMYFTVKDVLVPINKIDEERGANDVILFDSSFGESTCTNPWGMEIAAVDGKVTGVVSIRYENDMFIDNNSPIPSNGCVLSIQSGSPYFSKLDGYVNVGDTISIVTDNIYIYNAGKIAFDAVNPKSKEDNPAGWDDENNTPFPGYRGADQLIVYDSTYGDSTGTNPWGYEVVVNSDNKIVKVGGNNSAIPQGGYVLSGHGIKADWLTNFALIGSRVLVDNNTKSVLIIFTPQSFIDRAVFRINAARDELSASRSKFLDVPYDTIEDYINEADALTASATGKLDQCDYEGMMNVIDNIEALVDKAHFTNYESKKVETRAVWVRPKETDVQQVSDHLDKLAELNVNTIYLETWWGGYTIFPTENSITEQNPMYNGFDVLGAYLDEAHKRGMEVHCWVENFFIGDSATNNGGPVYAQKPEWLLLSRNGDNYQYVPMYDINYYFANPALPEVRDFIMGIYKELVKKYDIDGLQLDYVRYPDAGDGTNDFGYDEYTRGLFSDIYGTDPIDIYPEDNLWNKWCEFRANIINTFVYRVVSEVRALKPEMRISADVWPNYDEGPRSLMQEPKKWVSKGYIDNIIPMSYNMDFASTITDTVSTIAFAKGHAYVTIGLGTCMGLSKDALIKQVGAANDYGADGTALFEYESLMSVGYGNELKEGLYRNAALIGDENPLLSVNTILADILRKVRDIYLPNNGIDLKGCDIICDKLNTVINSGKNSVNGKLNIVKASLMNKLISGLIDIIENSGAVNSEVKDRMLADLESCSNILVNYIERASFVKNHPVDHLSVEMPLEDLKVGDTVKIKVKAAFADGEDVIMYIDPSQYEIKSSNRSIIDVQGDSVTIKGKGRANIVVTISRSFIYRIENGGREITQTISIVN